MFKKIARIALSLALLLYSVGIQRANTLLPVFPTGEDASSAQMPTPSNNAGIKDKQSGLLSDVKTTAGSLSKGAGAGSDRKISTAKGSENGVGRRRRGSASGSNSTRGSKAHGAKGMLVNSSRAMTYESRAERNELLLQTDYANTAGQRLVIRSGYRTSVQQAIAIYNNLSAYGTGYVFQQYRNKRAIGEIVNAYRLSRRRRRNSIAAMTRVIEAQVGRGIFISNHLRGRAFDVRSRGRGAAQLAILRQVVQRMGGRVLVEKDHYHVEL